LHPSKDLYSSFSKKKVKFVVPYCTVYSELRMLFSEQERLDSKQERLDKTGEATE
jgi:hypothetical protein